MTVRTIGFDTGSPPTAGQFARFKNASTGEVEGVPRDLTPVSLTYGATLTPAIADGLYRKVAMTGNVTLNAPSGTPVDGMKWRGRFTADGSTRNLVLNGAIKIPSASSFSGTQAIAATEMWLVQIEYSSALSAWILETLIGGWV